jgi:hypothetical protein
VLVLPTGIVGGLSTLGLRLRKGTS